LRGVVLELFRRAEERPMQVGGSEVNAAPVGVGVVVVQPIRPRADDATVDDENIFIFGVEWNTSTLRRRTEYHLNLCLQRRQVLLDRLHTISWLMRK
jgi:hypothetical protein